MKRIQAAVTARRLELAAVVVAFVPALLSRPGTVGADTKTYLYLDPGRLLADAPSLWDSDVALGTVTHQNIGYLWPMGPFYWVMEWLGSPDWVAQRLWLGCLLFAAGMGVRFLLRVLGWHGPGLAVAVFAYMLSPYLLDYSARISAVLLPWVGLPWMIGLTILAARRGGWRDPARFALVTVTVGSVNATSLLLVGLAPVLWLVHATAIERSITARRAVTAALRIGFLSSAVSVWWIAGLVVQGRYSLPVTRYTETYEVVADAATAPEILRGLGYWFFYGNDKFGPWIQPSIEYTQGVWLLFLTFGLVVLALLGNALVRWRHRSFFVLLLVVGALIGIGSHPFDQPSLLGSLFKEFTRTDAGLALRSTPRAVPLVVLATSVLLGLVVGAVQERFPRPGRTLGALTLVAIILANPAIWRVRMIEEHLHRPEELPSYWLDATASFDADDDGSRIWEIPGSDFASYRWGNTVDPITPGLIDRGYVARELVPFGSAASADLITAFDRKLQEGSLEPGSVVAIARLLSVGDLVHRADLTYERFRTPRPIPLAAALDALADLGEPTSFGPRTPNVAGPEQTLLDEVELSIDPSLPHPAAVTAYPVPDPLDIVRLRSAAGAQIVIGDGEGLVDAAAGGHLDLDRLLFFGADLAADATLAAQVTSQPTEVIITDSNRRRSRRWGTLRENVGYTELAGFEPLVFDPQDNRLPLFPAAATTDGLDVDDTRTVAVHLQGPQITASRFGNPVTHTLDDRPVHAADGDLTTAWTVADFAEARGEFLRFTFDRPTTIDTVRAVQPQTPANRHITEIEIVADDGSSRRLSLDGSSWLADGQEIAFEPLTGAAFDVVITDLDYPVSDTYPVGISPVGFAEITLGSTPSTTEWIRTPRAFVERMGLTLEDHDVTVVLTRERSDPQEPVRDTPELAMRRIVPLPVDLAFEVSGIARLDATLEPTFVDDFLRLDTGVVVTSTGSLEGNLRTVPSALLDGDPSSAFVGRFDGQVGQAWRVRAASPFALDGIELDIVVDRHRSVPTTLSVSLDDGPPQLFETGLELDDADLGAVETVRLDVERAAVSTIRIEVAASADRLTRDWYSNAMVSMPFAIAEMRAGTTTVGPDRDRIDTGCLEDVVVVDGISVPVRISGYAADARNGGALTVVGCQPVVTAAGDVQVSTARASSQLPLTIDQLVLERAVPVAAPEAQAALVVEWTSDIEARLLIDSSETERWLVLGQSFNLGWQAELDGRSLGEPQLVDGFANGWRIPAGESGVIQLRWGPQQLVTTALWASAIAALFVIGLALRRDGHDDPLSPSSPTLIAMAPPIAGGVGWVGRGSLAVAAGGFALVNTPQWHVLCALGVGAAVWFGLGRPARGRFGALLGAGLFGVTSLLIMIEQRLDRHPPDFIWPQQFDEYHVLGVITVLLLAGDYISSLGAGDLD
ncbi:MAG: alpha-(1-_3)-arabinofuranosyltransferase family protein [Actinomycetota bacterium]